MPLTCSLYWSACLRSSSACRPSSFLFFSSLRLLRASACRSLQGQHSNDSVQYCGISNALTIEISQTYTEPIGEVQDCGIARVSNGITTGLHWAINVKCLFRNEWLRIWQVCSPDLQTVESKLKDKIPVLTCYYCLFLFLQNMGLCVMWQIHPSFCINAKISMFHTYLIG